MSSLESIVLTRAKQEYSVVVLPEPVGPVTTKIPFGRRMTSVTKSKTYLGKPSDSISRLIALRSSTRNTTDSPNAVGKVLTRKSTTRLAARMVMRPSCGKRRSEIFRFAMTLMRETTASASRLGGGDIS